jgi:hypothetical protein
MSSRYDAQRPIFQFQENIDQAVFLGGFGVGIVQLQNINRAGTHFLQRIGDIAHDIFARPIVRRLVVVARVLHTTAAFGSDSVFAAAFGEKLADVKFAFAVIIGGVDEIDAGIDDGVENGLRLLIAARPAAPDAFAAHFHRAKAQLRDF